MTVRERHVLERAVVTVAKQAWNADDLVDPAGTSEREDVILAAKRLRLELLEVKAAIERELATFSLDCSDCGMDVHWFPGLGVEIGHWAHARPSPHGVPSL